MLEGEGSASGKGNSSGSGLHNLSRDALTDFRQSIKKVELPSFNGEDPAGWISCAEVYFRVQGMMNPASRTNLIRTNRTIINVAVKWL